jgi:hypothetical protein
VLFAAEAVREPGTVLNAPRGIAFLFIALASRAASYKVWERAQGRDEHLFWLIAPALVGAAFGGAFLSVGTHGGLQALSLPMWGAMLLVAMVGLTGYFYMNTVMSSYGRYRRYGQFICSRITRALTCYKAGWGCWWHVHPPTLTCSTEKGKE